MTLAMASNSKKPKVTPSNNVPSLSCITIKDILSDRAPKPYTLNAFMIFLTQNHCIETLDFITDAEVYCDIYYVNSASFDNNDITRDPILIGKQWKRLMATYICPGSPSEINLPSYIRDRLLDIISELVSSPSPEQLSSAMNHAYETLTEDVLRPFIRSFTVADNHYIAPEYIPKSTLSDSDIGLTANSSRRNHLYDKSIQTLALQPLILASRSPIDGSITKRVEHTQLPEGPRMKSRFSKNFKLKRWFSFHWHQTL